MNLSASELATLQFYQWERRLRGYYHFDMAVELEPYYEPFRYKDHNLGVIDDGRVPNVLERIGNLISPNEPIESEPEPENELLAHIEEPTTELVGFSFVFPNETEIHPTLFRELLNLLSYTQRPVSFEIIGTGSSIQFQFVSHPDEYLRLQSQIKAYFPNVIIKPLEDVFDLGIDMYSENITICDFGLSEECMRPIHIADNFTIDPLTSIIATLNNLREDDVAIFQVLFQGVTAPWTQSMQYAVSDGQGGSFFADSTEMPKLAQEKTNDPLFAVIMRIAVESTSWKKNEYIATELIRNITTISHSSYNQLIPLSNEGYTYSDHLRNVFLRCSNRLGFLLNTRELVHFVHYPNKTVVSSKLGLQGGKTKALPFESLNQKYVLGINKHNGIENKVTINDEARLRHTHIIGATGVGKSTLIANMMIEDMKAGNGCALFDPHGDIAEDILLRIPENRKDDVVIIDPSDENYAIGFNLLGASTDAEKIVLSSDLVSSFKRHATAWGDNMTAVLSNAINTFLESSKSGTLIELKRFLLEEKFRKQFLESVDDQSIHYYWHYEYPMVKKGIAPLLTRIDTFLRPKIIRYMLAQTNGIDFRECIEEKKILIIKLSQGLIGEENSYLLGSVFLSKLNQVAQGRQSLAPQDRHPYYIYLDEFQNFITPSITSILSRARKYGLGLILAHQELAQIDDPKTLNSVISNPYNRICFRLGDSDAKKLESGFSYFKQDDLQSLGIGQAIMRIGSSKNDFNLQTYPLPEIDNKKGKAIKESIIQNTRSRYAKPKEEVQILLDLLLPEPSYTKTEVKVKKEFRKVKQETDEVIEPLPDNILKPKQKRNVIALNDDTETEQQKEKYLLQRKERETLKRHRYLQTYIGQLAQQRGFKTTIEKQTKDGKKIDVVLEQDKLTIALEVAITNSLDYEIKNIKKCIDNGYTKIWIVGESKVHLKNIEKRAREEIHIQSFKNISFVMSDTLVQKLDSLCDAHKPQTKRIQGYRVSTSFKDDVSFRADVKQNEITDMILHSMRKEKKK